MTYALACLAEGNMSKSNAVHNRNEDADEDTRNVMKGAHEKCYSP